MKIQLFKLICLLQLISCSHAIKVPLPTVPYVDINKYMGKWYEIQAFPQWFQKGCHASTAEYSLNADNSVTVLNSCHIGSIDGKIKTAKGKAYVVDKKSNAKLKVTFFWPFYGDYWILDLDEDYEYVMIGAPNRKYLWILSRQPFLDEKTILKLREKAKVLGHDISKLRITSH